MDYAENGVVEKVLQKENFQSIKFRGRDDWFSNWGDKLKIGDIINFDYTEKGKFKNIKEYAPVESAMEKTIAKSTEPEYAKGNELKDKETSEIKSKIIEVTISRGQTKQFTEYQPTSFHVSMKAEFNESDNIEKLCSILTEKVETELNREVINETERQKNGS